MSFTSNFNHEVYPLAFSQANEIELLTDYHAYLLTSLDVDKVDLEPYANNNANITGWIDWSAVCIVHSFQKYRRGQFCV